MNRDILSCLNVANRAVFFSWLGTALVTSLKVPLAKSLTSVGWRRAKRANSALASQGCSALKREKHVTGTSNRAFSNPPYRYVNPPILIFGTSGKRLLVLIFQSD